MRPSLRESRRTDLSERFAVAAKWLLLGLAFLLPPACGDGINGVPATSGQVQVHAVTTGDAAFPDDYLVLLDGGLPRSIDVNGSVTYSNIAAGDHLIELVEVIGRCHVEDPNPRTVTVVAGGTASTTFNVECLDSNGAPPPEL